MDEGSRVREGPVQGRTVRWVREGPVAGPWHAGHWHKRVLFVWVGGDGLGFLQGTGGLDPPRQ